MARLHQIIATEKTVRAEADKMINAAYFTAKKPLFDGLLKTYEPIDDEGIVYPGESQKVVASAAALLGQTKAGYERLINFTVAKDIANTQAKADVVVDGQTVARDVPVTSLLWIEKQLVQLRGVLDDYPVTNIAEDWTWDPDQKVWRNVPARTLRQKKVNKYVTVAPATDKHAAQVVSVSEDVAEGWWTTQKLSGALSPARKQELVNRVNTLLTAVKTARESANQTEVGTSDVGSTLTDYLFA